MRLTGLAWRAIMQEEKVKAEINRIVELIELYRQIDKLTEKREEGMRAA